MTNERASADHLLSRPMEHAEIVRQAHQLADHMDEPGECYFIGGAVGAIKIGRSKNPAKRLGELQSGSPILLRVLATRGGGELREATYHYQFAAHRLHGEWFARCPGIEAEIARLSPTPKAAA